MKEKIDDLLAAEAKAVEEAEAGSDPNEPLPSHVKVTRGYPRARNLQVRFREDEFDDLTQYAEQRGLPVSTVVRALVLQAIAPADDLKSALDKLETDLAAVRRKALSA
ncbi:MAG TPA: hypothetical protein VGK78_10945 [Nocardioides sp.]|uniref:hypothetical protein n=1 Tax=Nocardioides sp. TaxID=35761 RepID=UPI002F42EB2B